MMKKLSIIIVLLLLVQTISYGETFTYSEDGKFGLKNSEGVVITEALYKKMIRIGDNAWLIQKGSKFGLMSNEGKILVEPKYSHADRFLGKYAKLGRKDKYGIFDEHGFEIVPVEYSSVDVLYGGMFLTCKNYKYGIVDLNGQVILDNIFDEIYMPRPDMMVIKYNGQQFEIQTLKGETLTLPQNVQTIEGNDSFKITEVISKPVTATGYYSVTATNYLLKIFSSISPAYEETIDELMLSQGADTVSILMKCSWIPRFPFVYAKKYYQILIAPNNGPLSGVKDNLRKELNN